MTLSAKEPARWPAIIPARFSGLLQRSMPRWLLGQKSAETAKAAPRIDADDSIDERRPETLPWWTSHHPALSFGARRSDPSDKENF